MFAVLVHPLGLPISISPSTIIAYNFMDSLPPGTKVSWCSTVTTMQKTQCTQLFLDLAAHALQKNLHILFWTVTPDAAVILEQYLETLLGTPNPAKSPLYGKSIVFAGMSPGDAAGYLPFALNNQYLGADYYGTPNNNLPMMAEFHTANDWQAFIGPDPLFAAPTIVHFHLNKITIVYSWALVLPNAQTAVANGIILGYVLDVKGAAEYEVLSHAPGLAIKPSDATSIIILYCLALVAFANVIFAIDRFTRKRGGK